MREADLLALRSPLADRDTELRALMGAAWHRVLKGVSSFPLTACKRLM